MVRNRKTAFIFAASVLRLAVAYAVLYYLFIPEDPKKFIVAVFIILVGMLAAFLANWIVRKLPDSIVTRFCALGLIAIVVALPFVSASMKQVTYSRFGFTVYGVLPLPLFDFTVNGEGELNLRAKTDAITIEQISALVDSDTTVIVIAQGWDSDAKVDEMIHAEFLNLDIHELSTPEAFEKYNELIRQDVKVVLVAHTN